MGSKSHTKKSVLLIIFLMLFANTINGELEMSETNNEKLSIAVDVSNDGLKSISGEKIESDLDSAESKDPKKSEIVKQIRRVNSDGSYTVGYEADDGTFKIESHDVLGNVKGTYGYVDKNGEVKRVLYTTNNTTGIKNIPHIQTPQQQIDTTTVESLSSQEEAADGENKNNEQAEESVQYPRYNRTYPGILSTTRRPPSSLIYTSPTAATQPLSPVTRPTVIQTIPRRRLLPSKLPETATTKNAVITPSHTEQPTTSVVYATPATESKPLIIIRPTPYSSSSLVGVSNPSKSSEQNGRSDKIEYDHVSKVSVANRNNGGRDSTSSGSTTISTTKTTLDSSTTSRDFLQERKALRGNHLRRQLHHDRDEPFEAQQQIIYSQSAGEDSSHVYSGNNGNTRPLFTTTSSPRVPAIVLAARHRAAQLQNAISSSQSPPTTTIAPATEKVYVKPPRRIETVENNNYEQTTEPSSEHSYLTQSPIPIVQIPANRDIATAGNEDDRIYRQRPISSQIPNEQQQFPQRVRSREYLPQAQSPIPIGNQRAVFRGQGPLQGHPPPLPPPIRIQQQEQGQYLKETTIPPRNGNGQEDENDNNYHQNDETTQSHMFRNRRPPIYPPQYQMPYQDQPNGNNYEQQSYPVPYFQQNPYRPYQQQIPQSPYYDQIERPLTTRDFERLLELLVLRHQQQQQYRLGYSPAVNPYYVSQGPNRFPPNYPSQYGYQQIPRPPIYDPASAYDTRFPYYRNAGALRQYNEPEGMYQAQSPIPTADQGPIPYEGQRLTPRKKQYSSRYFGISPSPSNYNNQQDYGQSSIQQDYLPPDVREELLYRMLMLAIQSEQQLGSVPIQATTEHSDSSSATSSPVITSYNKKPVRSVQIIGEE